MNKVCKIKSCIDTHYGRGYCHKHWRKKYRGGEFSDISSISRFWSKVKKTSSCWEWTGALTHGYGHLRVNSKDWRAHRFSYELEFGQIPSGLVLDHLCMNKSCVKPQHLEAVTQAQNVRRHFKVGV